MNRPRCTFRGCPVRYRVGDDRPCVDHEADQAGTLAKRMAAFDATMTAPPGGRDGQADEPRATADRSA